MQTVGHDDLAGLCKRSTQDPRGRLNLNLHPTLSDPIQRFFNAIQPGSYVRPHRHSQPGRWEVFVGLSGRAAVLELAADGQLLERTEIGPTAATTAVEIPAGVWHTVCALEPDTVLFELKPGPYVPLDDKDFAPWAPAENAAPSGHLVAWLEVAGVGARPPELA